jgi:glyoxylase-like metal-dependent hydrolase (beta-lactamase superfamily II)
VDAYKEDLIQQVSLSTGAERMDKNSYRFKIGRFECLIVSDGSRRYPDPGPAFFSNAPAGELGEELLSSGLDPQSFDNVEVQHSCLVVFTDDHIVLIDTGFGGYGETTGHLTENLAGERISLEDIDTVILTHAHPDHIGGIADKIGNPVYPNARFFMWKGEWDFWTVEQNIENLNIPAEKKELISTVQRSRNASISSVRMRR